MMSSLINVNPKTWYEAKWPYPSAPVVRENATLTDLKGRKYCEVSSHDVKAMQLSKSKKWWWVALKTAHNDPLEMRTRVFFRNRAPMTVIDIGLDFYPRRRVGVVSFARKN